MLFIGVCRNRLHLVYYPQSISCKGGRAHARTCTWCRYCEKKFDVALLVNGKLKHKVFTNNQEGFETLLAWLHKQNVDHAHVCLEASIVNGDELAAYTHDAGHSVSIVHPARIKGFATSCTYSPGRRSGSNAEESGAKSISLRLCSRAPPLSAIARAALVARFISTCCTSTGEARISSELAVVLKMISTLFGMDALRSFVVSLITGGEMWPQTCSTFWENARIFLPVLCPHVPTASHG